MKIAVTRDETLETRTNNKENKSASTFVYRNYTTQTSKYLQAEGKKESTEMAAY